MVYNRLMDKIKDYTAYHRMYVVIQDVSSV